MVRIIVSEVTSCQPSFETVFDKQQFEIVTVSFASRHQLTSARNQL
jgi:hypothetical protein